MRRLPSWVWDAAAGGGLLLVTVGAALAWLPAGFLVPGLTLLSLYVWGARPCS